MGDRDRHNESRQDEAGFPRQARFPAARLFAACGPRARIRETLDVLLLERTYPPKTEAPRSDWVAVAAIPAFRALARQLGTVESFCTIGTGAGLDALAAIEILNPERVVLIDLHDDVVDAARGNVLRNLLTPDLVAVTGLAGSLTAPLREAGLALDVIYENLPNLPLGDDGHVDVGHASATFYRPSGAEHPALLRNHLMERHFDALLEGRSLLRPGGYFLSVIGGRVPLSIILDLPALAGYRTALLVYSWKLQSEAHEVVPAYARFEAEGRGPFHYYPIEVLDRAFGGRTSAQATTEAGSIERALRPHAVTATEASQRVRGGSPIGHTVAVLGSTLAPAI